MYGKRLKQFRSTKEATLVHVQKTEVTTTAILFLLTHSTPIFLKCKIFQSNETLCWIQHLTMFIVQPQPTFFWYKNDKQQKKHSHCVKKKKEKSVTNPEQLLKNLLLICSKTSEGLVMIIMDNHKLFKIHMLPATFLAPYLMTYWHQVQPL